MKGFQPAPVPQALAAEWVKAGAWDDRSLGQFLDDCLRAGSDAQIRIYSTTRPYRSPVGEVYREARRLAAGLLRLGLGPGDVVSFQMPNWVEAAITFYGCALVGVVLVPIVHFYGPKETKFILTQSGAKAFIMVESFGSRRHYEDFDSIRAELSELETVVVLRTTDSPLRPGDVDYRDLFGDDEMASPLPVDASSPALIGYTSGTTSDPKGVVHSHRSLTFEVRQLSEHQDERARSNLTGAPVGHAIGMLSGLLVPIYRNFDIYLTDVWDPPTVLKIMLEEDVAAGTGSTFFLTSLLDCPGFTEEHLDKMRLIGLGGSPVPDAVADRAEALGISLVRAYGCTEHPSVTGSKHADPGEKRRYTDGRPLPFAEVRTVDEKGVDTPVGVAGEIITRGPDRFLGYSDPALTAEAVDAEGWFSTGDVGIIDAEGYLTITDRVKDIIIRGGENVSAAEVEQLLAKMPGVAEVAVVAAPDERFGEHGCAYFRMQAGYDTPDLDAIKTHLAAAGLARQKWPEELRTIDEFPRTASGKVQKFVLRDQLRAGG